MTMINTYAEAIAKAPHLIAIGDTNIYVHDGDFPIDKVARIEPGRSYRGGVPVDVYLVVEEAGLKIKKSFEFEDRSANGGELYQFRDRVHQLMNKLPVDARESLRTHIREKLLPPMEKHRDELQAHYGRQLAMCAVLAGLT
jgi:hypothetical protein